jgi:phospholipid/cholesterol/gamma-HCH transport system substrate-binding protein
MAKQQVNNIKLGLFVLAGLLFLVLLLYMIGKNRSFFGANFLLKTRFENIQGLQPGNNVRYSGINVGTVKKINIISDTLMEVEFVIEDKMKNIIRSNAITSIGTDGLVGNKVLNINPSKQPSIMASDGDILVSKKPIDTDEMLRTLYKTNDDIAIIAGDLKATVARINNSSALWSLLSEKELPQNFRQSASNIRLASANANAMMSDLKTMVSDIKNGKGSLGAVIADTSMAYRLSAAVEKIKVVADEADTLAGEISKAVISIQHDINSGEGPVHALLRDSNMVIKLNSSLDNIQRGTDAFNQNMEALKTNFLFRGYFRKIEKQRQKVNKGNVAAQ